VPTIFYNKNITVLYYLKMKTL